jgi:hypothetical protein
MGTSMDWGWLRANLPGGIEPGFDGMVLDLFRRRCLTPCRRPISTPA